jgi:hypothetical protein
MHQRHRQLEISNPAPSMIESKLASDTLCSLGRLPVPLNRATRSQEPTQPPRARLTSPSHESREAQSTLRFLGKSAVGYLFACRSAHALNGGSLVCLPFNARIAQKTETIM